MRTELEGALPEFTPQIDVVGGDTAKATVYLVPNGNSVSRTAVTIQSNTLPSVFFYTMRQYYEKKTASIRRLTSVLCKTSSNDDRKRDTR